MRTMSICRVVMGLFALGFMPLMAAANPATSIKTYPQGQDLYDQYPWSGTYYYGVSVKDPVFRIFRGQIHRWPEHLQSLEVSHTLSKNNVIRRFFYPLVGVMQIAANVTIRNGSNEQTIYEFIPYIGFRWANFPWNNYLNTSFALGEGISYATSVPSLESRYSENTKRLLNYMLIELTFAPPSYPRLQLVTLLHHRSGAYGLYHAGNSGSNDLSMGVRYLFD